MKIFCKSVASDGCLHLGLEWDNSAIVYEGAGIREVGFIKKHSLYVTRQGNFWKERNGQLYRLHNYGGYYSTSIGNQHRWYDTKTNKFLMAEKVTYDELLLEDLFLP